MSLLSAHRYVVLFNPLEQERLSVVSLLVSSPRVRVLTEEGQPLAVQVSAHWSSATDMVPDVYQVRRGLGRWGPALALCADPWPLSGASHCPWTLASHPPACSLLTPQVGDQSLGEGGCPEDSHSWALSLSLKGRGSLV